MDSTGFEVVLRRDPERSVITASGELDLSTTPRLQAVLVEACQDPPCDVLVDLTAVDFLDASTLGLLAAMAERLLESGCRVVVQGLSPLQDKVVRICHLEQLLTIP